MSFKFGEGKSGPAAQAMPFKTFESAEEIEEKKKKRQEEWEKVRRPDQPLTAPEEVYDPRSLYEQLQANKQKAQDEHDEKHRLSNQVKGLEDDEAAFLDYVSDRQVQLDNERQKEERDALNEYRKAVASHVSGGESSKSSSESKPQKSTAKTTNKKSQLDLLKGAVKRKGAAEDQSEPKKPKVSDDSSTETNGSSNTQETHTSANNTKYTSATQPTIRVGGILPGLVQYASDSTSDSNSSSSDSEGLADDTRIKQRVQVVKKTASE